MEPRLSDFLSNKSVVEQKSHLKIARKNWSYRISVANDATQAASDHWVTKCVASVRARDVHAKNQIDFYDMICTIPKNKDAMKEAKVSKGWKSGKVATNLDQR